MFSDSTSSPFTRTELCAIVVLTLLGAAVRFAYPSQMAIEHFDEGVYASNLLFPDADFRYPDRHLYAPSLVPALIEWSIIAFGDKGIAPMLPSLLFGTLTIPLIWWVGRQWFGPLAGIAAATLLSLSDFHIAFSRSALTDVPLCFWLLLAVYLFELAFRELSWPAAIAAGVTTGLAWWTKYNGWLPLAISLSGLMAWSLFARRDERHFLRRLSLWAIAAVAALVVWSPYWMSLPNGYAEVARNHSQYVVGFGGWVTAARHQRDSLCAFGSLISWVCLMAIVVAMEKLISLRTKSARKPGNADIISRVMDWVAVGSTVLFVATLALGLSANFWLLWSAFVAVFCGLRSVVKTTFIRIQNQRSKSANGALGGNISEWIFKRSDWLVAAWVVGLTVSVPLYRPYPRLALPWLIGSILMFVGGIHMWIEYLTLRGKKGTLKEALWFAFGNGAVCWAFVFLLGPHDYFSFRNALVFRCWESRSQFREIARNVTEDALRTVRAGNQQRIQNAPVVFYVYAEPGLNFHLPSDGLGVQPAGNLNFVDIPETQKYPTFLVTGPHAQRSRAFVDEFANRADQFELVASYPYDASDFVRLDEVSASQLRRLREPLVIQLYRVRPLRAVE